jgi:hypothetical protein
MMKSSSGIALDLMTSAYFGSFKVHIGLSNAGKHANVLGWTFKKEPSQFHPTALDVISFPSPLFA